MDVSGLDEWLTHAVPSHTKLRLKRLTRKEGPLASWPRMTRTVRHGQHLSAGCNLCLYFARVSFGKSCSQQPQLSWGSKFSWMDQCERFMKRTCRARNLPGCGAQ